MTDDSTSCSASPLAASQPPRATSAYQISDSHVVPQSDSHSVMAEQISHNVVEKPESTSLSLVDAASKQSSSVSADRGTYTRPISALNNDASDPSATLSDPTSNNDSSAGRTDTATSKDVAEPSAGGATETVADGLARRAADAKAEVASGEFVNGIGDDASQGEGPADDRSTADISLDASVNSDTDTSRVDLSDKKDGHMRTNSVKKPAIFSKVTATKNFMSKVAPIAPIAPKNGEKGKSARTSRDMDSTDRSIANPASAVAPPSSRPRLVAKTGASLASLQKSRLGTDSANSPDASKVWNKNRPTPQPTPRALTDEELKQQYGIHLATRLQSEENGKDSKWADIDDDEEDWAPETVVWMDGTKSTLTPQDTVATTSEQKEQRSATPQPPKPAEGVRPVLALKQRSDMKILKPGSAANQAKAPGASSPSPASEKGVLKPKSPAPAPTKSPWAPVPKVESISPINPPVQQIQAPPKLATQDARAYEPMQPQPAREIAADTFDRSWKESEGGTRELFNSTNGRYEPAPEGRRGSVKPDSGHRKPAVLQRPSQMSPAEPSPAFQSRTNTQMDGSWGRRRGSSVSQTSVSAARRLSTNQRPDLSQTPELPQDAQQAASGRGNYARPTFSQQSAWDRQMPPRPEDGGESAPADQEEAAEDPVKVQERVMKEKRELARKRRQEEEQREEIEKQERLKAKLAALEGAGKSKKEREAEAAAAAVSSKDAPTVPPASSVEQKQMSSQEEEPKKPAAADLPSNAVPSLEAQSSPPAQAQAPPAAAAPPTVDKLPAPVVSKSAPGLPERPLPHEQLQRQQPARQHLSPKANARTSYQPPAAQYNKSQAPSSYSSPGDRKIQPSGFERSPNLGADAFTPWPTTAPNRNVWGTAGIGNGTFESASAFAPVPMSQQNSALPPPPGMGRPATAARISPLGQESLSPSLQQQQISEQQRAYPPPGMESRPEPFSQSRLNGVSPAPGAGRPHPPGPIGPPSRMQQQAHQAPSQRGDPLSAWNSAAANLPAQYTSDIADAELKRKPNVAAPQTSDNRFKETFKKTAVDQGALGAPRRYDKTEYTVHDSQGSRSVASLSPAPPATQTLPSAPFSASSPSQDPWRQSMDNMVRIPDPSQNPAHGGLPTHQPPIGPPGASRPMQSYQPGLRFPQRPITPISESKDRSPPPPETESHPVNSGIDTTHPRVKLPLPQAKVRLPPASPTGVNDMPSLYSGTVSMPTSQRPPTYGPPKPLAQTGAWQARFNGLFNRTTVQAETPPSPPKTPPKVQGPSLAITSSSRTTMDEQAAGATVSLPIAKRFTDEVGAIDTKPTIDEMFKEELSFGSMPKVRIPRNTKYNVEPYPDKLHFANSRLRGKLNVQTGQDPFQWKHPEGYFVAIRGTRLHNKLCRKPGVVEARQKDGDRKPGQPANWNDRKTGQVESTRTAQNGANSTNWHEGKAERLQNAAKDNTERKHRFGKNRTTDKDGETAPAPVDKTDQTKPDGAKQTRPHKPTRQPRSPPTEAHENKARSADAAKSEAATGEKKKHGPSNKGNRSQRNTGIASPVAAATATTPAPIKSN